MRTLQQLHKFAGDLGFKYIVVEVVLVTVRIIAKCAPNENFPVQREIRERLKVALDRSGIRAPQLAPYGGTAPLAEGPWSRDRAT